MLLAMVDDVHPLVAPTSLIALMEERCGVPRDRCRVEVTYPADFFVTFNSEEDCTHVLHLS